MGTAMTEHSLDKSIAPKSPREEPVPRRRFCVVVIIFTAILNLILLLCSILDVYPRGSPGLHNVGAMLIGFVIAPIVNGLLMLIFLAVGASVRGPNSFGAYAAVAVLAPLLSAFMNLLIVLLIVP